MNNLPLDKNDEKKERLNCPKKIEEKFIIRDKSYSVYVEGDKEIEELKEYLDFDFIAYEDQKQPTNTTHIRETNDRFVVSCLYRESVLTMHKNMTLFGLGFFDFEEKVKEALPLRIFLNPEEDLKFWWKYSANLKEK